MRNTERKRSDSVARCTAAVAKHKQGNSSTEATDLDARLVEPPLPHRQAGRPFRRTASMQQGTAACVTRRSLRNAP